LSGLLVSLASVNQRFLWLPQLDEFRNWLKHHHHHDELNEADLEFGDAHERAHAAELQKQ
jgi:hypothetical protein